MLVYAMLVFVWSFRLLESADLVQTDSLGCTISGQPFWPRFGRCRISAAAVNSRVPIDPVCWDNGRYFGTLKVQVDHSLWAKTIKHHQTPKHKFGPNMQAVL